MSDEQTEMVLVTVDEEKCIGAGQCEMLEEDTFYVDDDTVIAKVIGTGMLERSRANLIVETCPSQAISIVEASAQESPVGDAQEDSCAEEADPS